MYSMQPSRGRKPRRARANLLKTVTSDLPALRRIVETYLSTSCTISAEIGNLVRGQLRAGDPVSALKSAERAVAVAHSVASYREAAQLVALFKKYPFTPTESGTDPKATAIHTFMRVEHRLKRVNTAMQLRGRGVHPNPNRRNAEARPRFIFFLDELRRRVQYILGETPDLSAIYDKCDFTGGAAIGVHGDLTNWGRKVLASGLTVSRSCYPYACVALARHDQIRDFVTGFDGIGPRLPAERQYEAFKSSLSSRIEWCENNKLAFVPKTMMTERSIAVEPLLNGFFQKGIDLEMRRLLMRIGIDLSDQSRNQEAARLGSLGGSDPFCTIDLSSASDSLSRELCRLILPTAWYRLLDDVRCHSYSLDGGPQVPYEKFVSMGNGFCFPLQTIIFSAVVQTAIDECADLDRPPTAPEHFLVYGDDIVVRQSVALRVVELLSVLGFHTNRDKTFITGSFRESCGADWMSGQAVRPVYLKSRLRSAMDVYAFHNSARRVFSAFGDLEQFHPLLQVLRTFVDPDVQFLRPFSGPDSAFEVALDEAMSCRFFKWSRRKQAWEWYEYRSRPIADTGPEGAGEYWHYLRYLASLRSSSIGEPLAVRRKTRAHIAKVSNWGTGYFVPVRVAFRPPFNRLA